MDVWSCGRAWPAHGDAERELQLGSVKGPAETRDARGRRRDLPGGQQRPAEGL